MRIKWIKSQPATPSASSAVAKPQFLAQDFLKLVAYAVASGVAFSALAIGVTLAVSRDSEAQTTAPAWVERDRMFVLADEVDADTGVSAGNVMQDVADDADALADYASPGSLYIGDGCGAEEVSAIEREWMVSIDGAVATVQVMQTFVMPDGVALDREDLNDQEMSMPFFSATLPKGATFLNLALDTTAKRLTAKVQSLDLHHDFDYDALKRITRQAQARGELAIYMNDAPDNRNISTDEVFDLKPGETIVVTYRYQINVEEDNGRALLSLPLQSTGEVGDEEPTEPSATNTATGTVWVEWKNPRNAPRVFDVFPTNATVEQNQSGIVGMNWSTSRIAPGEKFTLGWR
jgi:hypothetical protein